MKGFDKCRAVLLLIRNSISYLSLEPLKLLLTKCAFAANNGDFPNFPNRFTDEAFF